MFRHDSKKIHASMGINMMIAQVAGAYLGALYWTFVAWGAKPMMPVGTKNAKDEWVTGPFVFQSIMQEILGTFIFVLFFKIVTDERLHFSKEPTINCFIIACSYVASRSIVNGAKLNIISTYGACLNPAVAIGISLNSVINWPGDTFAWFWIYWLLPFVGSILSIIFYRFVYMKTQLMIMSD